MKNRNVFVGLMLIVIGALLRFVYCDHVSQLAFLVLVCLVVLAIRRKQGATLLAPPYRTADPHLQEAALQEQERQSRSRAQSNSPGSPGWLVALLVVLLAASVFLILLLGGLLIVIYFLLS